MWSKMFLLSLAIYEKSCIFANKKRRMVIEQAIFRT